MLQGQSGLMYSSHAVSYKLAPVGPLLCSVLFFLNELDECVSIDITEKYKGIALGGHNQEKEKETRE